MERRASWLELFFDLVLVAAVGALAAQLHDDHSLLRFAGLFVPVWWVWWGFTWWSSAFNEDGPVDRAALLLAMAGAGALAAGVPGATEEDSGTFVIAYAGLFGLLAALYARAWRRTPSMRPLSARYGAGYALGAALWLASLALPEDGRPFVWAAAMVVLMGAPVLAARSLDLLSYDAAHIAERYGLFTLIVLGESIVATVAGLDTDLGATPVLIALLGLVIAAAVWWLYFDRFRGMPAHSVRAGFVWAQGHLLVFAGIAAGAVGVELAIEAAAEHHVLERVDRLPLGAGLAAYLVAMAAIRAATNRVDWVVAARVAAGALLLLLALIEAIGPLAYVALSAAVLVAECAVDLRGAPPSPVPAPVLPHELGRRRSAA